MARWFRFIVAILVGAILGALYGWLVNPVEYVDTTPDSLRIDYKSDYVLMVAESYQGDKDLDLAARRLALLGDDPSLETVRKALVFAERRYTDSDVARMRSLSDGLQTWMGDRPTAPEAPAP